MSGVANLADLSGSPITLLIEEHAKGGFVVKNRNPEDGRRIDVRMTKAGLNRLRDAYAIHLASVRSRVMNHVEPKALSCLGDVMAAIVIAIEESPQDH